ncbi:MAG: DivIVA domain-containing protein [Clostridiales bacterium]|nr:DivIVA domain-containing protein [Clostridiales bacterium]
MEKITVDLISRKEFSISSKGYNQTEVDNFLDDICEEMERMENEIMELRQKTTAVRPAAPAPVSGVSAEDENSFREILEMARQVKDDTIRKAREDAEAIRAKAETEAAERLDGLEEEQKALKQEVADLKAAAADYRAKFEALLQAQQEALEKASDLF